MRDVTVTLLDPTKTKEESLAILDKDIEGFSQYMAKLDNKWVQGQLIAQERALIKSYLVWKLRVDQK